MQWNPYNIIIRPVNTEKSLKDADEGRYTFIVDTRANKTEVALAVIDIFDVDVVKVRMMNYAPKFKRWGRKRVRRQPAYKKAIVSVQPGQKIDGFGV